MRSNRPAAHVPGFGCSSWLSFKVSINRLVSNLAKSFQGCEAKMIELGGISHSFV
jgi:hypothetical protein